MPFAAASNWSHIRASMVPVRSPSSKRKYGFPSRVLRISFSQTRKNVVMFCSEFRSATSGVFIGRYFCPVYAKKAFSVTGVSTGLPRARTRLLAERQEFFVSLLLLGLGHGTHFLDFRAPGTRDVLVARFDNHVALLAERLEIVAHSRLQPGGVQLVHDFISDLVDRLLPFAVMLQHLKNQVALLGLEDVGKLVSLHVEDFVFELFRKFPALVNAQKAALLFGAAVGVPLGDFAKVFTILNSLERCLRFLLQRRQLVGALSLRADLNFAQRDLFRSHKFGFVRFVILLDLVIANGDVRPNFAADHFLREDAVADAILEVFPVHARLGADGFLQSFHALQFVLDANLVELLDHLGLDVQSHILAPLDQQRLVDQFTQRIFPAVFDIGL